MRFDAMRQEKVRKKQIETAIQKSHKGAERHEGVHVRRAVAQKAQGIAVKFAAKLVERITGQHHEHDALTRKNVGQHAEYQ